MINWKTIEGTREKCKYLSNTSQIITKTCSHACYNTGGWIRFCTEERICPLKIKKKVKKIKKPNLAWNIDFPLTNKDCDYRHNLLFVKLCTYKDFSFWPGVCSK